MNKIYFLIQDISTTGGTERVATNLINQLSNLNLDVTVFTLEKKNIDNFFKINESIKVVLPDKKNNISNIIYVLKESKRKKTPLIVISMGKLSFITSMLSILYKPYSLILSEHISFQSYSKVKRFLKLISYRIPDKIALLTNNDKDLIGKNNNKITVIPNMNPYDGYNTSPFDSRKNIALAIGRLTYQKNFERLINIWLDANTTDWILYIIGSGEEKNKIEKIISHKENIKLISECNNIHDYYNNAKLTLMTSRYEGLPMVLIESQHFGIPIISFDCKTGPKEIIENNINGYLIPYNNDFLYKEKLEALIADEKTLLDFHKHSLSLVRQFSPEKILKRWQEIIQESYGK